MFFRKFTKAESLGVADAHEFVLDCITSNIAGIHGAKSIKVRKVDGETIALLIREQEFLIKIEEVALLAAKRSAKRASKKTKTEGTTNVE